MYTSTDVTSVRAGYWSNDGEGTRPDSRRGVLDDKNAYVFFLLLLEIKSYCVYTDPIEK